MPPLSRIQAQPAPLSFDERPGYLAEAAYQVPYIRLDALLFLYHALRCRAKPVFWLKGFNRGECIENLALELKLQRE